MAKKKQNMVTVGIVEKQFFKHRVVKKNEELGEYLYEAYIKLLCAIGEETKHGNDMTVGLFTQVESTHKVRFFIVKEEIAEVLHDYFRFKMTDALEEFAKGNRKEGSNLLMQLNSGELTLKDFDDTVKS